MNEHIIDISLTQLTLSLLMVVPVLIILYRWQLNTGRAVYALGRMLAQLLIVGYFLAFLFGQNDLLIVCAVLAVMISASSWIALGPIKGNRLPLLRSALIAISVAGGFCLIIVTQGVLVLEPWYEARYMVPLAGMVFANAMNSVSLAAERMQAEYERIQDYVEARTIAFQASIIPNINSLFAVGLVSLPGMMTGQILSGVSPMIAARYQIVVMCMIFGSAGLAAALYLRLAKKHLTRET